MKRYMLLIKDENEKVSALFYDNYFEAEKYKDIGGLKVFRKYATLQALSRQRNIKPLTGL